MTESHCSGSMGDTVCAQPQACAGAKEEEKLKNPFPFPYFSQVHIVPISQKTALGMGQLHQLLQCKEIKPILHLRQ